MKRIYRQIDGTDSIHNEYEQSNKYMNKYVFSHQGNASLNYTQIPSLIYQNGYHEEKTTNVAEDGDRR